MEYNLKSCAENLVTVIEALFIIITKLNLL